MARMVAQDMEMIFGALPRQAVPVVPRPEPEVRSRSRNWARLAAMGLLSVTAAAGVITGNSVTATPAAPPSASEPTIASLATRPPVTAAAPALASSSVPAATAPGERTPTITPASAGGARTFVAAPLQPQTQTQTQTRQAYRPPVTTQQAAEPSVAPAPPAPAPAAYREPQAPAAAAPTRIVVDCDRDPQACFAARLEWADRRTGEAFETAAAAGVRPKTLREYRSEWNRARGKADDRPGDALRIMAMITHDLKQLTTHPAAR